MPRTLNTQDFDDKQKEIKDSEYARTIPSYQVSISAPFHWLSLALHDLVRMPLISAFYGLCFMGAAIAIVQLVQWQGTHLVVMPSLIVYMLIGPFLALGLYDAAWEREKGHNASLLHSMKAITRNSTHQWAFAIVLMVAMIFWMRIAALLHALYPSVQGAPLTEFAPFLITGSVIGFVIASLIFSISAFSIPLMMERRVDVMSAIFTSFNAVKSNIPAMVVWAGIIGTGILVGFATYGVGMIVTMPLLGYGTWHAYHEVIKKKHHV
ncbi:MULTISPECIES: DUF2189 domain-containing protein [Vibrio]|uniref:DUF2189 domain-containing protein n=1 Tax=Vibrio tasmaniensis TaxID=212663 RepID=A0A2N7NF11_9VIBR|nr:DUF2189 domain-containing protein [Vibrio tasmaniensis]PMP11594.1 hypothetical protein BCS92_19775 [Vibrio tasmaniensis]TKG34859.1 DUF2189 domain-containing protein [Vibrio tasmaniensis]TKG40501.1 DUF2189 domain-containing protein [Vibrio tasmaniensis]TKG48676.1 DUF2189 domain-containing protein [Vibrio tasmaniensis]TKG49776.1 DUF2189 domain-containing protein [Vibrio tasmaniensis]